MCSCHSQHAQQPPAAAASVHSRRASPATIPLFLPDCPATPLRTPSMIHALPKIPCSLPHSTYPSHLLSCASLFAFLCSQRWAQRPQLPASPPTHFITNHCNVPRCETWVEGRRSCSRRPTQDGTRLGRVLLGFFLLQFTRYHASITQGMRAAAQNKRVAIFGQSTAAQSTTMVGIS